MKNTQNLNPVRWCHEITTRPYAHAYDFRKTCLQHVNYINKLLSYTDMIREPNTRQMDMSDFYTQVKIDTDESWRYISSLSQQQAEDLDWFSDVYTDIFVLASMFTPDETPSKLPSGKSEYDIVITTYTDPTTV